MTCLHCQAPTSNGLALCETCQAAASVYLEFVPVYFRNLGRWKPGRAGTRDVPGSRVLYTGEVRDADRTGDRISDALDEANTALTTWARMLHDSRGVQPPEAEGTVEQVAVLCRWFAEHLTTAATLEWCGEFVRELGHHHERLMALTEQAAPGWYAGECARCTTRTYVVPGLTWVTCKGCGVTTYARDHLETILDEARGWVAPPKRIAEALVALVDGELSVPRLYDRIRKWAERGRVTPVMRTTRGYGWSEEAERFVPMDEEVGRARYRLGEVLDVLVVEGATRLDRGVRTQAG